MTGRGNQTPVHRLDARAKIVGFIGFAILVVTTPAESVWAFVLYAVVLAFLLGLARIAAGRVARRALVVVPFLVVLAAFVLLFNRWAGVSTTAPGDGLLVLWNAGAKAILAVLAMILLATTTTFTELAAGFERLRAPKVLVLTVTFMHRYSYLFLEESRRMRRAMASRNYRARWLGNAPVLGTMLGSLFLRSYNRGERAYVAMLSRGYDGSVSFSDSGSFGVAESVFLVGVLGSAVLIRVAASVWGSS
jgi:cobalt/nickel transport system permease protein